MLFQASRGGYPHKEISIETVYLDGNRASHFNPVTDSLRIYFVFFRFCLSSLATAAIDFLIFSLAYFSFGSILISSLVGRLIAGIFNFLVGKKLVFRSWNPTTSEACRYFVLVFVFMLVSNALISNLVRFASIPVLVAKGIAEAGLFIISFLLQNFFVFYPRSYPASSYDRQSTDWDAYYERPFKAASMTRRFTCSRVCACLKAALAKQGCKSPVILELGGGNSAFFTRIKQILSPSRYIILDKNRRGLEKFRANNQQASEVELIEADLLNFPGPTQGGVDVCFSVEVIEHFSDEERRAAIAQHFRFVKAGGVVLITFPTATFLYRITRFLAELFHLWCFPDEVPQYVDVVKAEVSEYGTIVEHVSIVLADFSHSGCRGRTGACFESWQLMIYYSVIFLDRLRSRRDGGRF